MLTIDSYETDLQQNVISRCEQDGEETFRSAAFTELILQFLSDSGELDDPQVCMFQSYGVQVSGYSISESGERVDLVIAIHKDVVPAETVSKEEVITAFKRVKKFFLKALTEYQAQIEESTPAFDLIQRLREVFPAVASIRFILITDGLVKTEPPKDIDVGTIAASHHIWDIERLYRAWSSGRERESITVNFEADYGLRIPCLTQPTPNPDYNTYLAILPATILSDLYSKHGPRLLERNVRSFLQAKGKINSGIKKTITREPHMFLAYNNGLSCTAEEVEIKDCLTGGIGICRLRDLQIVNGGQTTASLFHAQRKEKADLSSIFVQMKLTVLNDVSRMDEVVPRISEYANSQNKVQVADFAANDAYHRRLEELSRTVWAPAKEGTQRQTHWYYERARGQYQDDVAREGTPAKQKDFKTTNPLHQLFTKTDLAKLVYTWGQQPHIVSRGAQSCFAEFATNLEKHVAEEGQIDQFYFERIVARAILFRRAEKIVREQGYPGYRANIVTYSLARIARSWPNFVDLKAIWRDQDINDSVTQAICEVAKASYEHITTNANGGNVTQYCKKEDCWRSFVDRALPLPSMFRDLITLATNDVQAGVSSLKNKHEDNPDILKVLAIGPNGWFSLSKWAEKHTVVSPLDRKIAADLALAIGYGRMPSPRQAKDGVRILLAAQNSGFKV